MAKIVEVLYYQNYKKTVLTVTCLLICKLLFGQQVNKPTINERAYRNWTQITGRPLLSQDGNWVSYTYGSESSGMTLVFQNKEGRYKQQIKSGSNATFTPDSKWLYYLLPGDSLAAFSIRNRDITYIPNVQGYELIKNERSSFLFYRTGDALIIKNLQQNREIKLDSANRYWVNEEITAAAIQTSQGLYWLDLPGLSKRRIAENAIINNLVFSPPGISLAFLANTGGQQGQLLYYRAGDSQAVLKVSNTSLGLLKGFSVSNRNIGFNKTGSKLFFYLDRPLPMLEKKPMERVTVWNYKDTLLQSRQRAEGIGPKTRFLAVIDLNSEEIVRLEDEKDDPIEIRKIHTITGTHVLVEQNVASAEYGWNPNAAPSLFITSIEDGKRKMLYGNRPVPFDTYNNVRPQFSPDERFVIWFNNAEKKYHTYEVSTGKFTNDLTAGFNNRIYNDDDGQRRHQGAYGFAGWIPSLNAVLIYDEFDVWQFDLNGRNKPICLTQEFGRKHNLRIRVNFLEAGKAFQNGQQVRLIITDKGNLFDNVGTLTIGKPFKYIPPVKQRMSYTFAGYQNRTYLICGTSVNEAGNLFWSRDLRSFHRISDIQPQKRYNWLTAELKSYTLPNGQQGNLVVYKPENFDLSKKYPVIFHYYELTSGQMHNFKTPCYSGDNINIPTFVSNGYIVCTVDIRYELGHTAKSATDAIISAAKYMMQFPWVDTKKLGLQGHSFGGYETNCVITQSDLFAAACEASGPTSFVLGYGDLYENNSAISLFEFGQMNVGAHIWERPDLYIENSPQFFADKVTTPLLMMHNPNDQQVPYVQGLAWFNTLRRAGKKVWMLEYDGAGHGGPAKDFSIRMKQFFDHYLKDQAAPVWMTRGIPYWKKGYDDGLGIDTTNTQP